MMVITDEGIADLQAELTKELEEKQDSNLMVIAKESQSVLFGQGNMQDGEQKMQDDNIEEMVPCTSQHNPKNLYFVLHFAPWRLNAIVAAGAPSKVCYK